MSRPVHQRLLTALIALCLTAGQATAAASPGASGIGDPYFRLDGNGGYDVSHYDIHDRYVFTTGVVSGWTTLTATATQDLSSFNLDILLPVSNVRVNGVAATITRPHPHELRVTPATAIPTGGRMRIIVSYSGRPGRYSYLRERNWLEDGREAAAVNEPHAAPWWFAANDHPRDKATYSVYLTVPRGRQALSNGQLVRVRTAGTLSTWRWEMRQPMASYLAFMVVGRFTIERQTTDGVRMVFAVSRQLPSAVQTLRMRQLKQTVPITAWIAAKLGPYPFADGGGIALALPFWAALENQTRPVYGATRPFRRAVAHETAHEWLGDHVTIHRWRDIWLNEGFATYVEWWYEANHGGISLQKQFNETYTEFGADQTSFWQVPISNPGPFRLFTLPTYYRGAMALVALRNRIGAPTMETLLRRWIAERGGSTATTEQFIALAEEVSGQDLSAFFQEWLVTPKRPAAVAALGVPTLSPSTRHSLSSRSAPIDARYPRPEEAAG